MQFISISVLFLFYSGAAIAAGSESGYKKNPEIEAGESYEACMRLSPGDRLYYEFTSSADLRFNIHYHENKKVLYPVPVRLTSSEKSVFEPEAGRHYCLMWKNPANTGIELDLRYIID